MVDFRGRRVLEIGCGDGRLTWRYAERAAQVTAIDPSADAIPAAKENLPENLRGRVEFHNVALDDFATASGPSLFDLAILSWSL
ncbi:MAG: class I SAM-dependent methyltransferase [Candidatus Promineifilaceae bacterium]|nr:class I SAM-dependent methyltransferase [Candidatus Promineifilaceae bacterium]